MENQKQFPKLIRQKNKQSYSKLPSIPIISNKIVIPNIESPYPDEKEKEFFVERINKLEQEISGLKKKFDIAIDLMAKTPGFGNDPFSSNYDLLIFNNHLYRENDNDNDNDNNYEKTLLISEIMKEISERRKLISNNYMDFTQTYLN